MRNSKALFQEIADKINLPEHRDEIHSLAYLVLEHVTGLSRTDVFAEKLIALDGAQQQSLLTMIDRLNRHEPLQHIIGEANFYGRKFYVNEHVLIPRPETEELVKNVLDSLGTATPRTILDIGTGSGCIPVTLALNIPQATVYATDVSREALAVAKRNATKLNADVTFIEHNILADEIPWQRLDVITSNPPYVTESEKTTMLKNVKDFEPHLALFVSDSDPLIFYKAIATRARKALAHGAFVIMEINERFGKEVAAQLESDGFENVTILKDMFGKDRMVKGFKPA